MFPSKMGGSGGMSGGYGGQEPDDEEGLAQELKLLQELKDHAKGQSAADDVRGLGKEVDDGQEQDGPPMVEDVPGMEASEPGDDSDPLSNLDPETLKKLLAHLQQSQGNSGV